ncbi:sterol desaturase family protein [Prosthecobacter sp.]|uniref:sterol desaturase family protein n=1 Tax=Prosthecobacter sp. TaxID=1965333 RepID=UPI002ABCBDAB|nr:sterol desaturase family protein [Prosthecobacter sp.]MDZ4401997.1 sterol desaturase family protein [Prosthecobacter sp.]
MNPLHETRLKIRRELEAPPALRKFGSGWISGVLGMMFGLAALGSVVMMRFPGVFTMKENAGLIGHPAFRTGMFVLMVLAFAFSLLNLVLRPSKILGITGMVATLLAVTFGGTSASAVAPDVTPVYFGLDFFVLRLLFTGFLFIPLETLFPRRADQGIFRYEWREDLFYYLISSMMVQVLTWLSFMPAQTLFKLTSWTEFRAWVAALPFLVQLIAIMFLTDLVQYWVHRLFHRIPALWRFHAVHHSAQHMDWMAGARMHFLEILVLRGTTVFPMILLGFSQTAVNAYVLVVYLFATFAHSNLGWRLGFMEKYLVTPRFHHWHHGIEKEAIDVNFAIHFPLFDKLFGTHHMPTDGRWPSAYGIGGHPVPKGYWQQFLHPFRRKK